MCDEQFQITKVESVNDTAATFTFTSAQKKQIKNLKLWYSDPQMIGRHFLVYSKDRPDIKRHYTICSCMSPPVMKSLLELATTAMEKRIESASLGFLDSSDQDSVCLTIKMYQTKNGLSQRIHRSGTEREHTNQITTVKDDKAISDEIFYLKGPMGRGLDMLPTGAHVAFCAGTGALVFLDLVA